MVDLVTILCCLVLTMWLPSCLPLRHGESVAEMPEKVSIAYRRNCTCLIRVPINVRIPSCHI